MTPFAIAGLQMPVSALQENLTAMGQQLDLLMGPLPLGPDGRLQRARGLRPPAEAMPNPCRARQRPPSRPWPRRHGIWLLPGSLFEKKEGRIFNTAPVIDPRGQVIARLPQDVSLPPL